MPATIKKLVQRIETDLAFKWQIEDKLPKLTPRQAHVLRLRLGIDEGEPHTLAEVGCKLGVSRERIRQIEAKALSRLVPQLR